MHILAINCGSSSIKSALVDTDSGSVAGGTGGKRILDLRVTGIGSARAQLEVDGADRELGDCPDVGAAAAALLAEVRRRLDGGGRHPDASGQDRGLAVVEEAAGGRDAGVGGVGDEGGPGVGAGGGDRGGGEAGVDAGDEVELPGAALELPEAEGGEEGDGEEDGEGGEEAGHGKGLRRFVRCTLHAQPMHNAYAK